MIKLKVEGLGKRYRREWIFRNLEMEMTSGQSWALLGHNGSGKSTLMRILCGHLSPSAGTCSLYDNDKQIAEDRVYRYISLGAPYVELIEEFTLQESLVFHARFKPFYPDMDLTAMQDLLQLPGARNKEIRFFSSGMKQRLKLLLAFASDTPILFLDEPTTNLDRQGVAWYEQLVERFTANRLCIIASNVEADYAFCTHQLDVTGYKKRMLKS
ncbi:MAG: ABC transporter ATP-binding protein [Saprospiraceae bacterium]|nr:ABC transporter ATP-binding protein [Saprospiraceae bacterium]